MADVYKLKNKKTGKVIVLTKKPPFKPVDRKKGERYV